jgi:hypothetical protein
MAIVPQNKLLVPGTGLTGTQSLLPVVPAEPIERAERAPISGSAILAEGIAE